MRRCLSVLCFLALLAPAASASARSSEDYTYTYDQLWRAAVRLIAVDLRFAISDRDPEIGYVLFTYRDAGRDHDGSVELVRMSDSSGAPQVRVTMQVPSMPGYVERMLLDRFSRKLTEDYGRPPPTRRPAPAAPPVADDDAEDGEDDDAEGDATP